MEKKSQQSKSSKETMEQINWESNKTLEKVSTQTEVVREEKILKTLLKNYR